MQETSAAHKPSGACPTFFKASCREAREGGTSGYHWAARSLTCAVAGLAPYDVKDEEWITRVEALLSLALDRDDRGVLAWFDQNLPRCMALVPRVRRDTFVKGVYQAVDEEGRVTPIDPGTSPGLTLGARLAFE
jgi:hypothetical protein